MNMPSGELKSTLQAKQTYEALCDLHNCTHAHTTLGNKPDDNAKLNELCNEIMEYLDDKIAIALAEYRKALNTEGLAQCDNCHTICYAEELMIPLNCSCDSYCPDCEDTIEQEYKRSRDRGDIKVSN